MPKVPQRIVQRGNNRQTLFFHDQDYSAYLEYSCAALVSNGCQRALGAAAGWISGLMQSVCRRYVRHVNATYRRSGTLFEGR